LVSAGSILDSFLIPHSVVVAAKMDVTALMAPMNIPKFLAATDNLLITYRIAGCHGNCGQVIFALLHAAKSAAGWP